MVGYLQCKLDLRVYSRRKNRGSVEFESFLERTFLLTFHANLLIPYCRLSKVKSIRFKSNSFRKRNLLFKNLLRARNAERGKVKRILTSFVPVENIVESSGSFFIQSFHDRNFIYLSPYLPIINSRNTR